jgi:hypothetical protein
LAVYREFVRRLETRLRETGYEILVHPTIEGLSPDFLVKLPGGSSAIAEVKDWNPTKENQVRAIRQAELLKKQTGVSSAYIVLTNLKQGRPLDGLVNVQELLDALATKAYDPPRRKMKLLEARSGYGRKSTKRRIVFAAMPFDAKYDDTYLVAIAGAAKLVNAVATRVDRQQFASDIVTEIKTLIHSSAAVVADLSESRPNVLYETGYAHGIQVPTVHICSTSLKRLPFDVRNWNAMPYRIGQTHALTRNLARRLNAIIVK